MNQKVCPECRGPVRGRADKKYCCEACRNAFNNKKKGRSSELIKKINAIIKKNHFILKEKNPGEKATTQRKILEKEGFNFHYFTSYTESSDGEKIYYCYDQLYSTRDNQHFSLFREK